jgi:small GTP-binding protein
MLQKKICMLGTFAVGKTSLVRRFVESIYSDNYLTTVGVKIDKKVVAAGGQEVMLLLWDIQGSESAPDLQKSYLRGAAGYLLVADGTRNDTLYTALAIQSKAQETVGPAPYVLLLNKADLVEQWAVSERETDALAQRGWQVLRTSARTGAGVEEAFLALAQKMLEA